MEDLLENFEDQLQEVLDELLADSSNPDINSDDPAQIYLVATVKNKFYNYLSALLNKLNTDIHNLLNAISSDHRRHNFINNDQNVFYVKVLNAQRNRVKEIMRDYADISSA